MTQFKNTSEIRDYQNPNLNSFFIRTLEVDSLVLKNNPWGDPSVRFNHFLVPKDHEINEELPLVLVLSGFAGNGTAAFANKGFENNFVEQLDVCLQDKQAPRAFYCFVDAWTFWGGSQFINSVGMGRYQDYIIHELYPALINQLPIDKKKTCVMGISSGGYGALHLSSQFPNYFPYVAALAPDSFFERCYLEDLLKAAPFIKQFQSFKEVIDLHRLRQLHSRKDGFSFLNAIAMTLCYSGKANKKGMDYPIDFETGEFIPSIWKKWQKNDPIHFLSERKLNIKKIKAIYLDVGDRDQFHMHYGARKIRDLFKKLKVKTHYSEFNGGHFDLSQRRPEVWKWLCKNGF